jgi:hypothetical protein
MNRKLLWNVLFVIAAVGLGIGFSLKPWQVYREQRHAADAALADMRDAEKNRAELTKKKARYESAIGKEELARSQGYRQANETPVDLPQ